VLKRLHVDNVRCLTNFEIEPEVVTGLVGPNGGGKSTLLDVLLALQGILVVGNEVEEHFNVWTTTRWDSRIKQRLELDVEAAGVPFGYSLIIGRGDKGGAAFIEEERLTSNGDLLYEIADGQVRIFDDEATSEPRATFPFNAKRSFLPMLESSDDNQRITLFKQWLSGILLFQLQPFEVEGYSQQESSALSVSADNFVSFFRVLAQEQPEVISRIVEDMRPTIPGLTAIRLAQLGPNSKGLQISCKLSRQEFDLTLLDLSEGQRVLLVLYTILHALGRRASLLVFDEPDNYVAQSEIQPWLSAIRDATVETGLGTLMVISHHPEVIDYLAADQTLYFWRDDEGPSRVQTALVDRDQGVTLSQWLRLGGPVRGAG